MAKAKRQAKRQPASEASAKLTAREKNASPSQATSASKKTPTPATPPPDAEKAQTSLANCSTPVPRKASRQFVAQELETLRAAVAGCVQCPELARTRTQTVFGVGSSSPRLCFLGEAPGADEDLQGEPFVGKAGQLLNKIMDACNLKRGEVYILNILKCRPPGNRMPLPAEAAHCRGFLDRQLELLRPEFICCLGACAAQNLLNTQTPIGKLRGKFIDHHGARVICTYHPAYLLRNPDAKKYVWEDMKLLMREMGTPVE